MPTVTKYPVQARDALISREQALTLDRNDPLAPLRDLFAMPAGQIYLDGNSLGALPKATAARLQDAVLTQWGEQLIGSWNLAGWIDLPSALGAKIAALVGAQPDQVVVADSTSVNLFKVLSVALQINADRTVILSETGNFPTDLYVAQGLIRQLGNKHTLQLVERDAIEATLRAYGSAQGDDQLAVLLLTEVDYRTGSKLDIAATTALAHQAGALVVWDLAHSAGALPVALDQCKVDFAVGCGYKYLNGGPGAPAFLYAASRHHAQFEQPLAGWHGHQQPFAFETQYQPAPGIGRYLCGTPPVLSMIALDAGLDCFAAAKPLGGMTALRTKSLALTQLFADQLAPLAKDHALKICTPRDDTLRGSQISFSLPQPNQSYALVQALIAAGVVGDFRAPDICRFGFAPLYCRYVDAWDAAAKIAQVLCDGSWQAPQFSQRKAVT